MEVRDRYGVAVQVVHGPGPRWLRIALVVVAGLYYAGLLRHPEKPHSLMYFVEATKLFPGRAVISFDYRLEGWSCPLHSWLPLDPQPYFPMRSDDKESRFQRVAWFYRWNEDPKKVTERSKRVMEALDDYIYERHPDVDDDIEGPIGGIRVYEIWRPLPRPGESFDRYVYEPLSHAPRGKRKDGYSTPDDKREARCK